MTDSSEETLEQQIDRATQITMIIFGVAFCLGAGSFGVIVGSDPSNGPYGAWLVGGFGAVMGALMGVLAYKIVVDPKCD